MFDIADLHEVRVGLEALAFQLAARSHAGEGIGRLRSILQEELAAGRSGNEVASRQAGASFHECVNQLAGNGLLPELHLALAARAA